jgi:hypothetical protein
MRSKLFLAIGVVALVIPLACSGSPNHATGAGGNGAATGGSGGVGGQPGDDLLFVPVGLPNTPFDQVTTLTLVAFTLVRGATGTEIYAAVRNDGVMPACEAGMMIFFYDKADQPMTDVAGVLRGARFYRLEPGVVLTCFDPGEIAMAAVTGLADSIVIGDIGRIEHRFPLFTVEGIERIDGLAVTGVAAVTTGASSVYTGTLANGLATAVSNASVTIFPLNRVGRPLGTATASAAMDIPPGGSWSFQTGSVGDLGAAYAAYPSASIPD